MSDAFFKFVSDIYDKEHATLPDAFKPQTEVLLSGYSMGSHLPEVFRLRFAAKPENKQEVGGGNFNIVYSGQYDVIQRVVSGIDFQGYVGLIDKSERILKAYRDQLQVHLAANNVAINLPDPNLTDQKLQIFHGDFGGVKGLNASFWSLSEQAAINFVEFLIDTMIKAQQFSGSIPTVGGTFTSPSLQRRTGLCGFQKKSIFSVDMRCPSIINKASHEL